MTNINDFKLLNLKCQSYFNILNNELDRKISVLSGKEQERIGFYLYVLESICNIKDPIDIAELITDTSFNKKVFDVDIDDQGVDAIYIDDEQKVINIFNFKFRDNYNAERKQGTNETLNSLKFTNAIINGNAEHLQGKLKTNALDIIDKLNSREVWKFKLYVISNDSVTLDPENAEIKQLQDLYDLEVLPYGLEAISKSMSIRPKAINATLHLNSDSIMPYTENSLSSSKSYVLKLSAVDLIRITSNNEDLRNEYNLEDHNSLCKVQMDYNLLFDNVRGLVMRSKFNENIANTLKNDPSKFFMYNNGLTLIAADIIYQETNAKKKVKLNIKDFQIVNGGQTLRILHNFNSSDNDNIDKYLSSCEVLLRVFKITDSENRNKIAEYTNSQNSISKVDLKSLSTTQIQIEQFLDEKNIIYARKFGDTGQPEKNYKHKISMEKFGQILFAIKGFPEKSSNQKKQIFDKYYESIFGADFEINKSADYINLYYKIKNYYFLSQFSQTEQKLFYILYLNKCSVFNNDINDQINFLEDCILKYKKTLDDSLADARILIQAKFKEFVENEIACIK